MFEMTNELADYVNRGMPCIFAGGNPHEKIGCFEAEKGVFGVLCHYGDMGKFYYGRGEVVEAFKRGL